MKNLPGKENWFQKAFNGLKSFATKVAVAQVPGGLSGKMISEANIQIQERREALQAAQMQLSWVQHQDNLALRESLEKDRQAAMEKLAAVNHERSLEIQKRSQEHQKELEEYRAMVQAALQEKNLDFQRWRLQEEKELQLRIVNLRHQLDFEIAKYNRETTLNTVREQRRLANSPINLVPDDLLESPYFDGQMPLRILLSPPELNSDNFGQKSLGFKIENRLAEELREFLQRNYSFNGEHRRTQLLDGAWVSKKFRGGAGIQSLHSQLKAVPTVVLESEADDSYLNFRVAYWRGDGSEPQQDSILSGFPYREFLYESVRDRARTWERTKEKLKARGESQERIKTIGGSNEFNLYILKEEQRLLEDGIDLDDLEIQKQYKVAEKDFQNLHRYLIVAHRIAVGIIADIHYLTQARNLTPLLPELLPELLEDIPDNQDLQKETLDWLVSSYNSVYAKLEQVMAGWVPELMMQFAAALSKLEDKSHALQQAEQSVAAWLRARGIEEYSRKVFKDVVTKDDEPYFQSLQEFIENMEGGGGSTQIENLLRDWQLLNDELDIVPESPKVNVEDILPGEEFSFEVVTVNSAGNIIGRETQTNRQQVFDLGNGVQLEMVQISGGTFVMGAPEEESGSNDRERPQHEVTLEPFWMAKYPITQAQYQVITGNNPSRFPGENRPVERVNYKDAVEFCQQLSAKLGIEFALPSEAQWEYACRAGTTTPFYFGETITDQLANYDASNTYGNETPGEYRQQTTPVGSFPPNTFGLYDMHGNVWEWCADTWHDNYEGAPTDDSAWTKSGNDNCSPLRGGSWFDNPNNCRSAFRNAYIRVRDDIHDDIGFRVVCVAGRTLSP